MNKSPQIHLLVKVTQIALRGASFPKTEVYQWSKTHKFDFEPLLNPLNLPDSENWLRDPLDHLIKHPTKLTTQHSDSHNSRNPSP